jgi:hypothetical protein
MKEEIRYRDLFNELQNRLGKLKKKVDLHKLNFDTNRNWYLVGDIQYVNEQLKVITESKA